MRRGLTLLTIGLIVGFFIGATAAPASADVTGKACQSLNYRGQHVSICASVNALDGDTARAVASRGSGVQDANIEVDYVRCWIHSFFPNAQNPCGSNDTNYAVGPGPWSVWVQHDGFYCSGPGEHSRLHSEVRWRPLWLHGPGPWRILNSTEAECQA